MEASPKPKNIAASHTHVVAVKTIAYLLILLVAKRLHICVRQTGE